MRFQGEQRTAANEATFRNINEAIETGRQTRDGRIGFVCECGALGCNAIVELTLSEYEAVRADSRRFLVVPGHETAADDPLGGDERHTVVAKRGLAGELADATDPRAPEAAG